jgi:mercuric ion binding protein
MNQFRGILFGLLLLAPGASAQEPVYHAGVDGLACPFCAYGIEKQLQALPGVKTVETDIEQGTVAITMENGKTLDRPEVEAAVDKAGFSLRGFERAGEAAP